MADLIAKVSRSSTARIDSSGVYSHAISQLASGHQDPQLTFPSPAKVANKHPYNTCTSSDVELSDILYGKEFASGGGLEIDMKREVHIQVESINSTDTIAKGGSELENSISSTDEDTQPLKEYGEQAWQCRQRTGEGVGLGVHTKAWSCESEGSGC